MQRALERFLSVVTGLAAALFGGQAAGAGAGVDDRAGPTASASERARQIQLVPGAAHERQCAAGDAEACYAFGYCHMHGVCGVAEDRKRGGELYREACEAGSAIACFELGLCYRNGDCGVWHDAQKAGSLFRKACDGDSMEGCFGLGVCYWDAGCGFAPDRKEAQSLFERACDRGEVNACSNLAACYQEGECGGPGERSKAAPLAGKACLGGQLAACVILGRCYSDGDCGLSPNAKQAGELFRKACDGNNMRGCSHLGDCYAKGRCGVSRDVKVAESLFRRACEAGEPSGCSNWEECHARGDCRARDHGEGHGVGGFGVPAAGDLILGADYARILASNGRESVNLFAAGLEARLSGFSPGVPFSLALDATVGGGPGVYYDLAAQLGLGAWLGRYFGLAALGGVGVDSAANGALPFALKIPAHVWTGLNFGPVLRVELEAGANWLFLTEDRRKSASHFLRGYADEFQSGCRVFLGRRSSADAQDPNVQLGLGFTFREVLGTEMLLFTVGIAVATDPYVTRPGNGPI